MNKQMVFRTIIRCMHDRKLPSVIPKTIPIQLGKIGIKSPRKESNNDIYVHFSNLNEVIKEKNKYKKIHN